jgi:glutamate formiminotransferase/formiminotetrahydrofolate cyclodeaminase
MAVKSMGLGELTPFNPRERIIEYVMEEPVKDRLLDLNLVQFSNATSSESTTPGGGSIAAYMGALGISLGTMVANISSHQRGWDDRWEEFSILAEKGEQLKAKLLNLVDEDAVVIRQIAETRQLPEGTETEKKVRKKAIQETIKKTIEVPFQVLKLSAESLNVIKYVAEHGFKSSVLDAGVGAICAQSAILGAYLRILLNCRDLDDPKYTNRICTESEKIKKEALVKASEILDIVELGKIK